MHVEFDPFEGVKRHVSKHREAYITGLLGFALGVIVRRRPIVIQNIVQR